MKQKKTAKREALEIIAAFFVAWLAYQAIALVTGTPLPIVSVVSDSMYHTSSFDDWWRRNAADYAQFGIGEHEFTRFPNANGLSRGDLLVAVRPENPKVGDILIYRRFGSDFTVVHRLVGFKDGGYVLKGDNNHPTDSTVEKRHVVGKMVFAVPILGYPRLVLHLFGI